MRQLNRLYPWIIMMPVVALLALILFVVTSLVVLKKRIPCGRKVRQ
jgi:uncharacterized membrane protein